MTVAQLIQELKWCNQEAEVKIVVGLLGYPIFKVNPDGKFITKQGNEIPIVSIESR
jgi:hypothetical protein